MRALFQPFGREMLSTDEYVQRVAAADGHGKGNDGFLFLSEEQLGSRRGEERPVVGPHVAPQRQLTQVPDEAVMEVCCVYHVSCVPFFGPLGVLGKRRR